MKNFIAGFIFMVAVVAMFVVFSKGDDSNIYSYLPEGEYTAGVISVRVKGDETLSEILINNEDKTGMSGIPVDIQIREWERFSGRDADFISAGEDLLLPCYIRK